MQGGKLDYVLLTELHPRLVASPKIPRLAVDTAVFDENMALLM